MFQRAHSCKMQKSIELTLRILSIDQSVLRFLPFWFKNPIFFTEN